MENKLPTTQLLLPSGRHQTPSERAVKVVEKTSEILRSGQPLDRGEILREVGYSEQVSKSPSIVFNSPTIIALFDQRGLSDNDLTTAHEALLNARKLEHMIFPLGPSDDVNSGQMPDEDDTDDGEDPEFADEEEESRLDLKDRTTLTDGEIKKMLAEVGCTVKRIVHGNSARHVYFWTYDSKARKDALDMAYQIRGSYAPKKIDKRIGVYSMKDLRAKAREKGIKIIDQK